jgi:hypothetical protein
MHRRLTSGVTRSELRHAWGWRLDLELTLALSVELFYTYRA